MADQPKPKGKQAGNLLTRKYGPLPGWAYVGIAAGGTWLYLRHRNATSADASSSDATDTTGDTSGYVPSDGGYDPGDGQTSGGGTSDFPLPYVGGGDLSGELTTAQAQLADEEKKEAAEAKRLKQYQTVHPAGRVNKKTRVYTPSAAGETWGRIANRFGVTVAALKKANPNVKGNTVHKGQKVHIPG